MWRRKVAAPRKSRWLAAVALAIIGLLLPVGTSSSSSASTSSQSAHGTAVALGHVACVTSSDCWAVGDRFGKGASMSSDSLIEHWTGHAWAIVKAPRVGSPSLLAGVSCTSAVSCWAVGATVTPVTGDTGLIDHWQGVHWVQTRTANLDATTLDSVTCPTRSRCWAVGSGGAGRPVLATWDGRVWAAVSTRVTGLANHLDSVSCPAPTVCWAVGYSLSSTKHGTYLPLVLKWNGQELSVTLVTGHR